MTPKGFFGFFKNFRFHNQPPFEETDLVSPALWSIAGKCSSLYGPMLPIKFSIKTRKMLLKSVSFRKKMFSILSFLFFCAHYVMSVFILIDRLYFNYISSATRGPHQTMRTVVLFYGIFACPLAILVGWVLTFRGKQICEMINPIAEFGKRLRGKIHPDNSGWKIL